MEIWHHIAFDADTKPQFMEGIDRLGIGFKISPSAIPGKMGGVVFDMAESHPGWPEVDRLVREYSSVNLYETTFSEAEILAAAWCRLMPRFEQGYPQPESTWLEKHTTYEGRCDACGVYERQRESFRIKKEPHLGKKQFMTLHWGDALFVTPTVLAEFVERRICGFAAWPVLIHNTGLPAEQVAQVYVPKICEAAMIPEADSPRRTCSLCGVTKYEYHKRGYMNFDRSLLDTELDFVMSREWFGSGRTAFREMLVSRRVAHLMLEQKWQGAFLKPVLPLG